MLTRVRATLGTTPALTELESRLREVNEHLWTVEDSLRELEARGSFGPEFVDLARSVYLTNDRRSVLKRAIAELLGSRLMEEKCYSPYPRS